MSWYTVYDYTRLPKVEYTVVITDEWKSKVVSSLNHLNSGYLYNYLLSSFCQIHSYDEHSFVEHLRSFKITAELFQTRKDAPSLPTTTLCIKISIYSIHVGCGSFRFVQSLDSFLSKQSQPHLQSGRILSLSLFLTGLGDGYKVSYCIFYFLEAFTFFNSLQQPCGKYRRVFSL